MWVGVFLLSSSFGSAEEPVGGSSADEGDKTSCRSVEENEVVISNCFFGVCKFCCFVLESSKSRTAASDRDVIRVWSIETFAECCCSARKEKKFGVVIDSSTIPATSNGNLPINPSRNHTARNSWRKHHKTYIECR